ncbi:hypothetical protein J6590_099526, partial [Homalodisca vitripennis]
MKGLQALFNALSAGNCRQLSHHYLLDISPHPLSLGYNVWPFSGGDRDRIGSQAPLSSRAVVSKDRAAPGLSNGHGRNTTYAPPLRAHAMNDRVVWKLSYTSSYHRNSVGELFPRSPHYVARLRCYEPYATKRIFFRQITEMLRSPDTAISVLWYIAVLTNLKHWLKSERPTSPSLLKTKLCVCESDVEDLARVPRSANVGGL